VLYDARCNLCARFKAWLAAQPSYLELEFVAAGSEEARRRFPALDHAGTLKELTVVSDTGDVYVDAGAWVICLWALPEYRAWALRLGSPDLLPLARRAVLWISQNRFRFGERSLEAIVAGQSGAPADCAEGYCNIA
jgi:predicted DCC family thiol-disulfide oxidoreductase YuxK